MNNRDQQEPGEYVSRSDSPSTTVTTPKTAVIDAGFQAKARSEATPKPTSDCLTHTGPHNIPLVV
jgi:hypothetical protein